MNDCRFAGLGGWMVALGLGLCVALVGCSKSDEARGRVTTAPAPAPAMKAAPPTPIAEKKEELGGSTWDPEWDAVIEKALPPEMLSRKVPQDVRRFCPRFYQMSEADKRAYWAYFFQALAGAEAGLDPTTRVRHTEAAVAVKDEVTGRMVRSEGLLQLTYEDARRYGCDFNWNRDKHLPAGDEDKTILQPDNNLQCGVKILDTQIIDAGKPLFSRSGYWSTLRPGTRSFRVFAKQMTNTPAACRVAPGARGSRPGLAAAVVAPRAAR